MAGGAAFPLAKLGFLVIKQISKPIAQGFARRAKQSRIFREYICIPIAQFYHWYDVKVSLSKFKDRVPFFMFCFLFFHTVPNARPEIGERHHDPEAE